MNITILVIIFLLFIAGKIALSYAVNAQSTKTYYRNIEDHKLVEANVRANYSKKYLLITQYAICLLFIVLIVVIRLRELVYPTIILFLCFLLLRGVFTHLEILTTTEIEYRKFKKDKANNQ